MFGAEDAELEISLKRWDEAQYEVELRYTPANSDADRRMVQGPSLARFDLAQLAELAFDPDTYGKVLSAGLFADPEVREALAVARSQGDSLRVRLFIQSSLAALHQLRWETLRDPEQDRPWLTGERVFFSRYLSSQDWRPVRSTELSGLQALVVVASPTNVDQYQPAGSPLAALDVEAELTRAREALANVALMELASGTPAAPTLSNIVDRLRQGCDVLYLVAHGALIDGRGEPRMWLESDDGRAAVIAGQELISRLAELQRPPTLVVLASCQSAGRGQEARSTDAGVLAALGPRLAGAGVPAVVAMQGNVTQQTLARFMPAFFRELRSDGRVDRAMAVARGEVRERSDYWTPTLFMRLRSGRLWQARAFASTRQQFEQWPALLGDLADGQCTPILGPGMVEPLFGLPREIARNWAEYHHFPMAIRDQEDLSQVAQYLAIQQSRSLLLRERDEYLRREILRRYANSLPDDLRRAPLDELLKLAGSLRRERVAAEPHAVLARLPLRLYLTTNSDDLLAEALRNNRRDPHVQVCAWYQDISPPDPEPEYEPDEQHPLVYHLFGHRSDPKSLVLTQDDYFNFLIRITGDRSRIPPRVRKSLVDTGLLFLGFQMDDWTFRLLFRTIMSQPGISRQGEHAHIAVQLDPEAGHILEPERARRYLESYFGKADMRIYWDTLEDFLADLDRRCASDSYVQLATARMARQAASSPAPQTAAL